MPPFVRSPAFQPFRTNSVNGGILGHSRAFRPLVKDSTKNVGISACQLPWTVVKTADFYYYLTTNHCLNMPRYATICQICPHMSPLWDFRILGRSGQNRAFRGIYGGFFAWYGFYLFVTATVSGPWHIRAGGAGLGLRGMGTGKAYYRLTTIDEEKD